MKGHFHPKGKAPSKFTLDLLRGRVNTSLAGTLTGSLTTPGGSIPFMRSDNISDTAWGFADVVPIVSQRWNFGVHNVMTYITGNIPVGAYDAARLSNIGIGHGAIDGGVRLHLFRSENRARNSRACSALPTTSVNPVTQYQSGADMHFDWGASQFLTKQLQVGVVGYVYDESRV